MIKQLLFLILILLISSCSKNLPHQIQENGPSEIIDSLIESSNDISKINSLRTQLLEKATQEVVNLANDSLKIRTYLKIASKNLAIGNLEGFRNLSQLGLKLSLLKKDTSNLALIYYNLGYYNNVTYQLDSAFFYYNKAKKTYGLLNNKLLEGTLLINLAGIQSDEGDYIGSEIKAIEAISYLKNTNKYRELYLCYNILAYGSNQLKKYDEAIEYRLKGKEYLSKFKNSENLELFNLNGIGVSYKHKGEWDRSIEYFEKALATKSIARNYPLIYAVLIDNLAYSKFKKGDTTEVHSLFLKSLTIRDSLNIVDGIIINNLHLSEYFLFKKDSAKAIQHAIEAKELSKNTKNHRDLLESFLLLSKLLPSKQGNEYLLKHIKLRDSLQHQERIIREKFTRIAYETDEIILEKEAEVKKNWLLTITLIVGSSFFLMVYIFLKQRAKNKDLQFHQKQDEANIEIYNLLLSQQTIFQDGSDKEKKRISRELHDGVLGRLFGTRLSLDTLNESTIESEILERGEYIEELQLIEEDIRKIAHNLKSSLFNSNTSFIKLVEQLIIKQRKICIFECELNFNNVTNWENISNSIQINCYRILQESLQNINKYAKATKVQIDFYKEEENLVLTIKDDGVGFNTKTKKKGIGLKNMKSRATSLKGIIEFRSNKGKGTKVKMTIPLENIAE